MESLLTLKSFTFDTAQMSMSFGPCSQDPSSKQSERLPGYLTLSLQVTPLSPALFHLFLGPPSHKAKATRN